MTTNEPPTYRTGHTLVFWEPYKTGIVVERRVVRIEPQHVGWAATDSLVPFWRIYHCDMLSGRWYPTGFIYVDDYPGDYLHAKAYAPERVHWYTTPEEAQAVLRLQCERRIDEARKDLVNAERALATCQRNYPRSFANEAQKRSLPQEHAPRSSAAEDASMMAAAPEMLELLKSLHIDLVRYSKMTEGIWSSGSNALDSMASDISRVLAKARGE